MEFENERIIILEDSPTDLLILQRMLINLGFRDENIDVATSLSEFKYDKHLFVLCDLNLPDSSGKSTLKAVLNDSKRQVASVIVLTGMSDEQLAQEAIQLGAQDYLIKGSFSQGVLKKTLVFSFERNRLIRTLNQNQKELIEIQKYLETILETAPGVIIRFREDLTVEYVSRSILGLIKIEQVLGSSLLDISPEEEKEYMQGVLDKLFETEESQYAEGSLTGADGKRYSFLYRASAVGDGTYILIATDITELVEYRRNLEKQTLESEQTQLQLLSAQMNPHFIFNALSSIQHLVLTQEIEPSLNFISSFANLMRQVLENSRRKVITWKEEKEFLRTYLAIEEHRYDKSFDIRIAEDEQIDPESLFIPPMLIQPYVENTVVHGLAGLKSKRGAIKIEVSKQSDCVLIAVEDNGIGREKALANRELRTGEHHTSRALGISKQRIELLNSVHRSTTYNVEIEDLYADNGEASGTRVTLKVPADSFMD